MVARSELNVRELLEMVRQIYQESIDRVATTERGPVLTSGADAARISGNWTGEAAGGDDGGNWTGEAAGGDDGGNWTGEAAGGDDGGNWTGEAAGGDDGGI
ncbi:hypothetical protein PsorP6_013775 [Peronosclerospora sorghi]|uniref:Uncharacterized protein n=1 Tax=Peronosclerospora sorghi TaxID=230839 RepID=A0ACC0VG80_9STRA|nr:hypothetical protein PsorP6_013775 [Peronosclerospora sorghi]